MPFATKLMKLLISLLLTSSCLSTTFGQINRDSIYNVEFRHYYHQIDSSFTLGKSNELEFRMWTEAYMTSYKNLFVLTKNTKGFRCRFFETASKGGKTIWAEREASQSNLDSLWRRLVKNHVLTLPSQSSLKARMRIYSIDSTDLKNSNDEDLFRIVGIMDGVGYRFEVISPASQRTYNYDNPEGYLKYFSNIEEFYRASVIIALIKQHLQ
jgi:hypothetical protein